MTDIKDGANGLYKDDGENLRRVDQGGNGSKKTSFSEYLRHILPLGDWITLQWLKKWYVYIPFFLNKK